MLRHASGSAGGAAWGANRMFVSLRLVAHDRVLVLALRVERKQDKQCAERSQAKVHFCHRFAFRPGVCFVVGERHI
jgi:hypothetical protein